MHLLSATQVTPPHPVDPCNYPAGSRGHMGLRWEAVTSFDSKKKKGVHSALSANWSFLTAGFGSWVNNVSNLQEAFSIPVLLLTRNLSQVDNASKYKRKPTLLWSEAIDIEQMKVKGRKQVFSVLTPDQRVCGPQWPMLDCWEKTHTLKGKETWDACRIFPKVKCWKVY